MYHLRNQTPEHDRANCGHPSKHAFPKEGAKPALRLWVRGMAPIGDNYACTCKARCPEDICGGNSCAKDGNAPNRTADKSSGASTRLDNDFYYTDGEGAEFLLKSHLNAKNSASESPFMLTLGLVSRVEVTSDPVRTIETTTEVNILGCYPGLLLIRRSQVSSAQRLGCCERLPAKGEGRHWGLGEYGRDEIR